MEDDEFIMWILYLFIYFDNTGTIVISGIITSLTGFSVTEKPALLSFQWLNVSFPHLQS